MDWKRKDHKKPEPSKIDHELLDLFNGKDVLKTITSMIAFKSDLDNNDKIADFVQDLDGYSVMYGFLRGTGQSHEFATKILDNSPLGRE